MVDDVVGHLVDLLIVVVLERLDLVEAAALLDLLRHEVQELLDPLMRRIHRILRHVLGVLEHVAQAVEHDRDHLRVFHRQKLTQWRDHTYTRNIKNI